MLMMVFDTGVNEWRVRALTQSFSNGACSLVLVSFRDYGEYLLVSLE